MIFGIIQYIECISIVGKYIFIIAALLYPRPYKRVCRGTVGGRVAGENDKGNGKNKD
jgi:hypothetical protein